MTLDRASMPAPRPLTPRERDVLARMVRDGDRDEAVPHDQDAADRRRWLTQVDGVRVHGTCGCGTCPTIDLGDATGPTTAEGPRVVLSAGVDHALVLLFVDGDRLSRLELAPLDETVFPEFPPAVDLRP
ncbi:hypothetical protein ACFVTZ_01020 [Cellulosimicrobium cellulans]|uniref:hypothetical protein n=1 Tax=Cellulosimicrobium cellulans TaxID=1710 RepID=UPI0036E3D0E1